jgi:hypothetical protein
VANPTAFVMQLQNTGLSIDGDYLHIIEDGTYHYEYLSDQDAATQFVITTVDVFTSFPNSVAVNLGLYEGQILGSMFQNSYNNPKDIRPWPASYPWEFAGLTGWAAMQCTFSGEVKYTGDMLCEVTGPEGDVFDIFYIWSAAGSVSIYIYLEETVSDFLTMTPGNYVAVGMY